MFERTSERAKRVLVSAREQARLLGSDSIGTEHLLLAILEERRGDACDALRVAGVTTEQVRVEIAEIVGARRQKPEGHIPFTPRALHVIERSLRESEHFGAEAVEPEHVLISLIQEGHGLGAQIIVRLGGNLQGLLAHTVQLLHEHGGPNAGRRTRVARELKYWEVGTPPEELAQRFGDESSGGNRTVEPHPVQRDQGLAGTGTFRGVQVRDLSQEARDGKVEPVVGFDALYDRILRTLGRRSWANVLLVGDPGVGKTALVTGLARRLVVRRAGAMMSGRSIYRIALHAALGETSALGEPWLDNALAECEKRGVVPFFDDVHRIAESGRWRSSASDLLYAMSEHGVPVLAAMTAAYFEECLATDVHLLRRFRVVHVAEPTPEQALEILRAVRGVYEEHHRVRYTDTALEAAVRADGAPGVALPARAIDLIDEAGARERVREGAVAAESGLLRRLQELRREKSAAIDGQDFETAARLREEEKGLHEARAELAQKWRSAEVGEDAIAEVAAALRAGRPPSGG